MRLARRASSGLLAVLLVLTIAAAVKAHAPAVHAKSKHRSTAGAGFNSYIFALAVQPTDGKVLAGGSFYTYTLPNNTVVQCRSIARLNVNFTLDTAFCSKVQSSIHGAVEAIAIQSDGAIIIGGQFISPRKYLLRLKPDGSLDPTFNIGGAGPDGAVYGLAVQPDNKVLVVGEFTHYNGQPRNRIARLYMEGSLEGFIAAGASDNVASAVAPTFGGVTCMKNLTGKCMLFGGNFTKVNNQARSGVVFVESLGSGWTLSNTPYLNQGGGVSVIATRPTGTVYIGGLFSSVNGIARNNLARLDANMNVAQFFNQGAGPNNDVLAIAPQQDGQVLVGGVFTQFNNNPKGNHIARINANGVYDPAFNVGTGPDDRVYAIAIVKKARCGISITGGGGICPQNPAAADSYVIIAGNFEHVDGSVRNYIARLDMTGKLMAP